MSEDTPTTRSGSGSPFTSPDEPRDLLANIEECLVDHETMNADEMIPGSPFSVLDRIRFSLTQNPKATHEIHLDRIPTLDEVTLSPSTSMWLKRAVGSLTQRDILDALRDAEILCVLIAQEHEANINRETETTWKTEGATEHRERLEKARQEGVLVNPSPVVPVTPPLPKVRF